MQLYINHHQALVVIHTMYMYIIYYADIHN